MLNAQLIVEALNRHTNQTFKQCKEDDGVFMSQDFNVIEISFYEFAVERVIQDTQTGIFDAFPIGDQSGVTLADIIDLINRELGG